MSPSLPELSVSDPEPELIDTASGPIAITREGPASRHQFVCLHGVPGSHWDYRYLAPLLAESHRVIRIDMPGFKPSPWSDDALRLDGWTDVVGSVVETLEIESCTLLAHSMGAVAAVASATRWPDKVRHIALLAPVGHRRHRAYAIPRGAWRGIERMLRVSGLRDAISPALLAIYVMLGNKPRDRGSRAMHLAVSLVASMDFDAHTARAAQLPCPALVAHSRDDPAVQFDIGEALARTIPSCETLFFDDGGHKLLKFHARAIAERILASVPTD